MPRQTITLSKEEHVEILLAVGGQNKMEVGSISLIKDGQVVEYDEVRLEVENMNMVVRSVPEDNNDYRSLLEQRQAEFLKYGYDSIHPDKECPKDDEVAQE